MLALELQYMLCLLFAYPQCILCFVANNDFRSDIH